MYLPCWYEGLSWQEQYDCYWINGIIGKWDYLEEQRKYSFYSLLPLRFYDRDNHGYYIKPESAEKGNKTSSRYVYAFELWKTSCKYILSAMPDIEKIEFGEQQPNGIYPIKFRYPVEEVLMCQKDTMKKLIENGFPFNSEETAVMFKKDTHYSYEQCEEYYKIFDERILTIGNQQRNYYSRNTNLDLAIKNKDIAEVKRIIKQGINLNEIYENGQTVFQNIFYYCMYPCPFADGSTLTDSDYAFLEEMVAMGANPGIYGNFEDSLLNDAVTCRDNRLVKWLLEKGVNPNIHPFLDDYYDAPKSLLDWVYELDGELYLDDDPEWAHKINLEQIELLEAYGAE